MDSPTSLLVVEDDETTARSSPTTSTADGFKVATAGGAGEGLRAIEVRKPQLVILDLLLEDGNGLDAARPRAHRRRAGHRGSTRTCR